MSERVEKVVPAWANESLGMGYCRFKSRQMGQDETKRMLGVSEVLGLLTFLAVHEIGMGDKMPAGALYSVSALLFYFTS